MEMSSELKEALGLVQRCLDDWPYAATRVIPIMNRLEKVKELLLKEQEPKQVKTDMYGNAYCPWCSTDRTIEMGLLRLHLGTRFCPYCGKAVNWDDSRPERNGKDE